MASQHRRCGRCSIVAVKKFPNTDTSRFTWSVRFEGYIGVIVAVVVVFRRRRASISRAAHARSQARQSGTGDWTGDSHAVEHKRRVKRSLASDVGADPQPIGLNTSIALLARGGVPRRTSPLLVPPGG